MTRNRNIVRGFTLIELLVVVAIIVALLALLMPSLNKAMGAAQRAVCGSNTRQIQTAWMSYTADHFGGLFDYVLQRPDRLIWTGVLKGYYSQQPQVLVCPSTDNPPGTVGLGNIGIADVRMGMADLAWCERRAGYFPGEPYDKASYTYNTNLNPDASYNTAANRYQGLRDIAQPSATPVVGDGVWRDATPGIGGTLKIFPTDLYSPETSVPGNCDQVFRYATSRHGTVSTIVFADGHAEAVPLKSLWSLRWHKNYDTTTPVSGAP